MNFRGINGERAEAIRRVLASTSQRLTAQEIVDGIWAEHFVHLLNTSGNVETIQAVLREMERRDEVDRVRRPGSREDWWGLR